MSKEKNIQIYCDTDIEERYCEELYKRFLEEQNEKMQRRIDKAIEVLGKYEHHSLPTEQQSAENEKKVDNALSILKGEDNES